MNIFKGVMDSAIKDGIREGIERACMPSIEEQVAQLKAAGWKQMRPSWMWKSPSGALWLGPHGAWKEMNK